MSLSSNRVVFMRIHNYIHPVKSSLFDLNITVLFMMDRQPVVTIKIDVCALISSLAL